MIPDFGVRCKYKTAIALDGGSIEDLFTISGGPVLVTCMVMELTEDVSAHATTMAWKCDPTTGLSTHIGTALDINGFDEGDWVYAEGDGTVLVRAIMGDAGTKLPRGIGAGTTGATNGTVFPVGGIDMIMSNATIESGIGTMFIVYMPMMPNAVIV